MVRHGQACPAAGQEGLHRLIITVRAAAHHGDALGRCCAGGNRLPRCTSLGQGHRRISPGLTRRPSCPPCALPCHAEVQRRALRQRRRQHHAQHGPGTLHQRDVDRELPVAGDELTRAVQRVHQPEARALVYLYPHTQAHRLLGHHRQAWRQRSQTLQDAGLGLLISEGDGRSVGLVRDLGASTGLIDRHDHLARLQGQFGHSAGKRHQLWGTHA